jgi:hypothetical protein
MFAYVCEFVEVVSDKHYRNGKVDVELRHIIYTLRYYVCINLQTVERDLYKRVYKMIVEKLNLETEIHRLKPYNTGQKKHTGTCLYIHWEF